jgi:hypothetical protein
MTKKSDQINRKFVESVDVSEWEVLTDSGWRDISASNKTIEYEVFEVKTSSGRTIKCADDHILFSSDLEEVFAKDSLGVAVATESGPEEVTSVKSLGYSEEMYDLTVESEDHRYYTNGFLSHNTTCVAAFFAWYVIFHNYKTCAILANKAATAREILSRVQRAYENLPKWMQHGVIEWNKGSLELENGSKILAASTSSSAIRGFSVDTLFLDEFAFVPNNIAEEFFASVYPTIASGKNSKLAVISTPNGLNHFHKIVKEAEAGINGFATIRAIWSDIPTRDEKWAADTRATLGDIKFGQEMECKFVGGSNTLISGEKLASLPASRPIAISETLKIYEEPVKSNSYVMTVDTARGLGGDYSAFVIFDVTTLPYKIVAVYRDNKISPILYPGLILKMATHYNTAAVLIENNDMGESISNSLYYELEYDMVIKSHENVISSFGGRTPGFKTTKKSKSLGCSTLKTLVEGDKLDIRDSDIIYELSNFVAKGSSFEADVGNDDLAMCLVMFSYLTIQPAMEDFTSVSAKNQILIERMKMAEEEMMPVGGFTDGTEQELDVMNF